MSSLLPALKTCLLGREGRQRVRVSQALLAWTIYAVLACVQQIEVALGLIEPAASSALTLFNLCGASLFYLLIRSGVNQIVSRDPSLSGPQMVFALIATSGAYAIAGPARGAMLGVMVLVLSFGIFTLTTTQARRLAALGFSLLGGVMLWKGWTAPAAHDPRVEAIHLLFAGVTMASIAALAARLGRMRQRLRQQKGELGAALQRIQALATRDALTGLLNRRAMLEQVQREVRRARRDETGGGLVTGLVLFDLDHFKRINDTLGHRVGDRVLQAFAELASAELRASDVLARWGGEEFLLLLPHTSAEQALACVERIRQRLLSWRYEGPLPLDTPETP
ncbi:MAG TPA: GGDEF domain-containing protein, partial [Ideonella sp.]|nr:GGDEF domain-containing protein [Ideonella sp.]